MLEAGAFGLPRAAMPPPRAHLHNGRPSRNVSCMSYRSWQRRSKGRPSPQTTLAKATELQEAPDPERHIQAELLRKNTADQLLQVIDGNRLSDKILEAQLHSVVHTLPVRVFPPRAWHTLERAVAQSGKSAFANALAPRWHTIPPFQTTAGCGCSLASSQRGRRFKARELNLFVALLFGCLPAAVQTAGLPQVHLNRFDLHHAHVFLTRDHKRLGVLFHAKEYPAHHLDDFPVNLGNCQKGSSLRFDQRAMDFRNILWYDGSMCALDVGAGSLLHERLLMDGLQQVRTVQEADFGTPLADLNYFHELQSRRPRERVFVCIPGT